MMEKAPLVSIVMPSFNHAEFIEESIRCVLNQSYFPIELEISDGGSNDGTIEILTRLSNETPKVRWVSEPDTGPANAINKSLKRARGTIIGWLNSDDLYTDGAIQRAVGAFAAKPNVLMIYGHGEHITLEGAPIARYPTLEPGVGLERFSTGSFICQPTAFFTKSMHFLLGDLDENCKVAFDYEYWMRAFSSFPERIGFIDAVQAQSRLYDACITKRLRRRVALESMQIASQHLGHADPHWLTTYIEEVSQQSAEERGFEDLHAHAIDALNEATPYLKPGDADSMRRQFEMLRR